MAWFPNFVGYVQFYMYYNNITTIAQFSAYYNSLDVNKNPCSIINMFIINWP